MAGTGEVSEEFATTASGPARRLLREAIKGLDIPLRRAHRVFEFSDNEDCLLRIAIERAEAPIRYADGVVIDRGERVITLHFWNEHLPLMPSEGPTMAWANRFRRQLNLSLRELALRVQWDPRLKGIKGVRASLASATAGHRQTVRRFGAHFGLQILPSDGTMALTRRLGGLVDNLWAWALAWAFNPPALNGRDITKVREEIGMSRPFLIAHFGDRGPESGTEVGGAEAVAEFEGSARRRRLNDRPEPIAARWRQASP